MFLTNSDLALSGGGTVFIQTHWDRNVIHYVIFLQDIAVSV